MYCTCLGARRRSHLSLHLDRERWVCQSPSGCLHLWRRCIHRRKAEASDKTRGQSGVQPHPRRGRSSPAKEFCGELQRRSVSTISAICSRVRSQVRNRCIRRCPLTPERYPHKRDRTDDWQSQQMQRSPGWMRLHCEHYCMFWQYDNYRLDQIERQNARPRLGKHDCESVDESVEQT